MSMKFICFRSYFLNTRCLPHLGLVAVCCLLAVSFAQGASLISFDDSAKPTRIVLGDAKILSGKGSGFKLRSSDGEKDTEVYLRQISESGDQITVSHPDGLPSFTFRINTYDNHLAIHLLDVQGIGTGHGYRLSLVLDAEGIGAYTLNDLMERPRRRKTTVLTWPHLWGRARADGTRGSVVLFDDRLEGNARDAVMAEIWSTQSLAGHMVRPAGQTTWSESDVLAWVERWAKKFETMAVVSIGPESEEELYAMTDKWVIPSGANRVYMFSTVWRGEYTLRNLSNESVAGDAFPNGKEDLLRYSEYLAKHGAHVQLKSLVPQLGWKDARYFSEDYCEPRLLSWGRGSLLEAIDSKATTLLFKPGPDHVWERASGYLRIGNELIWANDISIDREQGHWILTDCERGKFATTAKTHPAGAEISGVLHSYRFVHFADDFGQPDSLAEAVLTAYGDFLDEVNAGHLHFDGTGKKAECPWYLRDYTDSVYRRMSHPVTGSIVGGSIPANFEKMFRIAERATQASSYWGIRIGPRLDGTGSGSEKEQRNFSPSLLDIHFDVSDRIVLGGRRPNFTAGRSGGVLSQEILDHYGFIDEAYELFKDWVKLAPVFAETDADYVRSHLTRQKGSNHYEGEDVLVLGKDEQGDYIFTPHRVMGRVSGEDAPIRIDQEWGALPRFQDVAAGTRLTLFNPYQAQEPQVVIRVEPGSTSLKDPVITINGSGTLAVEGAIQAGEYMKFEGGQTVAVYDANWNLKRRLPAVVTNFRVNPGNNEIHTASARGGRPQLRVQCITLGPVYLLESNKHL